MPGQCPGRTSSWASQCAAAGGRSSLPPSADRTRPRAGSRDTALHPAPLAEQRMPQFLSAYLITLVLLVAIDFVWLAFVARSFYVAQLGDLMRPQPDLVAAALFYAVYAAGITHF